MKIMHRNSASLVFLLLSLICSSSRAQSISTDPINANGFCSGESVSIGFTVTGNFEDGNSFIVQLSDPNGSFTSGFQNIGSVSGTSSGTVLAKIPVTPVTGIHYRIRINGSKPYRTGSDNGSDLAIGPPPTAGYYYSRPLISVGDTITFTGVTTNASSVLWNFGDGASPSTSTSPVPPPVSYSTIGLKTVSLTATSVSGCSTTYKHEANIVYSCNPQIPANVVVDSVAHNYDFDSTFWVQPGVTYIAQGFYYSTIFAEPGSSVYISGGCMGYLTAYLKAGSSYAEEEKASNSIIYEPGAGLQTTRDVLIECSSLSFDYSHAPHSRFVDAVTPSSGQQATIRLYPNPVSQMLFVDAGSAPREVIISNELGNTVIDDKENLTSKLEISTVSLPSGTYYVKLIYNDRIEVNKVLVVH